MESNMNSFLDLVLVEEVSQSKVLTYGTIHRLNSDGMESMGEGELRIFHHVDRGKIADYC